MKTLTHAFTRFGWRILPAIAIALPILWLQRMAGRRV